MREDYNVTIINSMRELTPKEKIKMKKATSTSVKIDDVTEPESEFIIESVDNYVILHVYNEHAENTEYDVLVIESNGATYTTGSAAFTNSFLDICDEMSECGEEFGIVCQKIPSRNFKGKYILTCNII